ncbi:ATP-dependent helicase [Hathewaya limosa]|uniref:DNA 3'-5' helicase n=1 Tax=Hathewaya limosa TaxID=1536 RepID=A0ABU0JTB4_HATLI|nr:ATP-dependent helicase [Hathewaya limosa]MDQ0479157.1 DNA helicase-2/ATP-dependent DNA helicase PcrA [Hathewaya limosa]
MVDLSYLDENQKKAVLCKDKNSIIIAAPGSGKTTTIIHRVFYLVDKGISRNNIIVITFTKAAAINMRQRYENKFNTKVSPFFGTFHSLFYKILKRAGYEFEIISSIHSNELIKKTLLTYYDEVSEDKVREVLNYISCFKTSNLSIEEFSILNLSKKIFKKCYENYENYKKEHRLFDFDDLQIEVLKLFRTNENLKLGYSKLFKFILVDEFQDCDAIQMEILKLFSKEGSSIFAVGDEDQCIYGFRGSKPECMVQFDKIFENGKKLYLDINYRSPKNIVDTSKSLICNNKLRNKKNINSNNLEHGNIKFSLFNSEGEQSNVIGDNIIKLVSGSKYLFEDNIVMYRTNEESRSIIDSFIKKGIPFTLMDREYNFYDNFICKDILAYLRLGLDIRDKGSFFRIINKPFRYIGRDTLYKFKHNIYKENCFDILCDMEELKPFQLKNLRELEKEIVYLNKMSLSSAIDYVLYELDYYKYIKEYCERYRGDLSEFDEIINSFRESASEFKNILSFLSHIEKVKEEIKLNKKKDKRQEGVLLSTIHGVKGMEFKNVFLINCNEEVIPHVNSMDTEEGVEEERRLFYVGITRAKENLWLNTLKDKGGKEKKPSRFLKEMDIGVKEGFLNFKVGKKINHKAFGKGIISKVDENTIIIDFDDGMCRKLDSQITYYNGLIEILS